MKKLFLFLTLFFITTATNIFGMTKYDQDDQNISYLYDQYDQDDNYDAYIYMPNPRAIQDYVEAHKYDDSNVFASDLDTTEEDEPEATKSKEEQAKTNPDIDELNNPKVKLQEFLATVYESLKINISCDTKLMDTVLCVPVTVTNVLNEFRKKDKRNAPEQKMSSEQEMRYSASLILIKEILARQASLKLISSGNTYLIEKTESKTSDKN